MAQDASGGQRAEAGQAHKPAAFRRQVFYIPGYDPFPPRRYRELYRKEGAEQARLSGYDLALTPGHGKASHGWQVEALIEGRAVETRIEVMVWSDIVRRSMSDSILATYLQLIRTAWAYIGSGALFRLMRLRKGPMIAALYPVVFLLLQLVLACLIGGAVGWGQASLSHWLVAVPVAALVIWAVLRWFRAKDHYLFAWYLMHDYAYTAQENGANPAELEQRMFDFGKRIQSALSQDFDEVLVVGHSSGAHLGISILADLIRSGLPDQRPDLSFLSLGQVVPMVSFLPGAKRLRADLAYLSTRDELAWIDVTAPGDGCAFALCDPVLVSVEAPLGKRWPLVLSAAFTQTLSPARWKALRRRWFRLHFQYLCAFDNLQGGEGEYDYFRITAGPQSLRQRFANRRPSKSRIERLLNRYKDLG